MTLFDAISKTVCQWEPSNPCKHTRDALRAKIAKGERVGAVLYGFRLAADGKTQVEDYHEQKGIARIKQLRAEGRTLRAICNVLDDERIKTKGGRGWEPTTVNNILKRVSNVA